MTTNQRIEFMPASTASLIAESVGSLLREAREEIGVSLHEVSLNTKIPEKYLALFEQDAHDRLVDDVYTKIYLKAYGKYLGFETTALVEHYHKERARLGIPMRSADTLPNRHPTKAVERGAMVVTPKLMQTTALALTAIALLGWFGTELKKIVAAPSIAVSSPQDGFVTYDRSVAIEGVTEKEVTLVINGKSVSPDADGKFKDLLNLQEGLNTITITGAKKHSKGMSLARRVIVLPKAEAPLEPSNVMIEEVPAVGAVKVATPKVVAPKPAVPAAVIAPAVEPVPSASPAPTETAPAIN